MDVDVDALDGWTLCWSNVYNDDTPEAGLLSDVWAACDGNYLMYAAGEMVDGDYANFNGSGGDTASTDGLADTGFDSSALVGLSAVLVSLGAVSVIRRRRRS
jgi:LPXTG-motif cell wall-anchored protein